MGSACRWISCFRYDLKHEGLLADGPIRLTWDVGRMRSLWTIASVEGLGAGASKLFEHVDVRGLITELLIESQRSCVVAEDMQCNAG